MSEAISPDVAGSRSALSSGDNVTVVAKPKIPRPPLRSPTSSGWIQLPSDYVGANAPKAITDVIFALRGSYWRREGDTAEPIHIGALTLKLRNHAASTVRDALFVLARSTWLEITWVTRFTFRFRWREFSPAHLALALAKYRRRKSGEGRKTRERVRVEPPSISEASARCEVPSVLPSNGAPNGEPNGAPILTQAPETMPVSAPARSVCVDLQISEPSLPAPAIAAASVHEGREGGMHESAKARNEEVAPMAAAPELARASERRSEGQDLAPFERARPSEVPPVAREPEPECAPAPGLEPGTGRLTVTPDGELERELTRSIELEQLARKAAEKFRSERCPYIDPRAAHRILLRIVTELGWALDQVERWIAQASQEQGHYRGIYRGSDLPLAVAFKRLVEVETKKRIRATERPAPAAPLESSASSTRATRSVPHSILHAFLGGQSEGARGLVASRTSLGRALGHLSSEGSNERSQGVHGPQQRSPAPVLDPKRRMSDDGATADCQRSRQATLETEANDQRRRFAEWRRQNGDTVESAA